MHNYKELKVWQKARTLVREVYAVMPSFPADEKYGIVSQIKRAAISIPTNISEGCGRNSVADLKRFLDIAYSSAFELENLLILSCDLSLLNVERFERLSSMVQEVQKMIFGLKNKISTNILAEPEVEYLNSLDT